jgi:hypothetical protein
MAKYRNKMVYDASTGELRDDRKHMSMLEDFWLPRREGGKGTEITTLPAGQNLGELEDVKYFRQKLLNSLNVPISRLEPQQGGMIGVGRTTEVTRDEVKFTKFIVRLRNKFSQIFDHALKTQLVLKGICSSEEWEDFKEDIYYNYMKDNNFTEMDKETIADMKKQIAKEDADGTGGPTTPPEMQQQQQSDAESNPPVDNTQDDAANESLTPQLDSDVEKYSSLLNKR